MAKKPLKKSNYIPKAWLIIFMQKETKKLPHKIFITSFHHNAIKALKIHIKIKINLQNKKTFPFEEENKLDN